MVTLPEIVVTAERESPDINNQVPQDGIYYPQDFSLEGIKIENDNGEEVAIDHLLIELCIFEDIYTFVNSGYMIIRDALGLVDGLKLDGNEFVTIKLGKTANQSDDSKIYRKFRIYKIGNKKPVGNMSEEFFTLYFCSESLVISEQIKISKSYSGMKISDIINNILSEQLKVDSRRINEIQETTGIYDFVVPRMKPFEALSWLSTYARPQTNSYCSDMLLFETKDGYNFRSLNSMFRDTTYATYKYSQKNLDNKDNFGENEVSVLDYEYIKSFDTLNETSSGTYANRLISIDPLTRSYKKTDFDYEKYTSIVANAKGEKNIIAPGKNRLGIKQNEAYEGTLKVAIGNSQQKFVPYISEKDGSVAEDIFIETYVPNRTAQLSLANYTTLKLSIPGDTNITAGTMIEFKVYKLLPENDSGAKELDEFFSGRYLVSAVRHVVQTQGVYQTILEIVKNTTEGTYSKPDPKIYSSKAEIQ
jgi:hypothetical protein